MFVESLKQIDFNVLGSVVMELDTDIGDCDSVTVQVS